MNGTDGRTARRPADADTQHAIHDDIRANRLGRVPIFLGRQFLNGDTGLARTAQLLEGIALDFVFVAGNPNLAVKAIAFQIVGRCQRITTVIAPTGHQQNQGPPETTDIGQPFDHFGNAIAGAIHQLFTRDVKLFGRPPIHIAHLCHADNFHVLSPFSVPKSSACATA